MPNQTGYDFETEEDDAPARPGQLSSNGHWVFGSIYATLALVGFSFGVWAGASKPKTVEVADAKQDAVGKPIENTPAPAVTPPEPTPPEPMPPVEPKPKEPDLKPMPPEPKMTPEPKKPPEPKVVTPEPKKPVVRPVAFKEIQPILRTYCNNCHGVVGRPKGDVDLRTLAAIMKGGKGGDPIVIPGEPEKSPLYESITAGRMPYDGGNPPSPKELQLLHDWIASGAKE